MAVYKVRDPEGNIREISGPDGASDADIVAQAKRLFTKAKSDVKAQIDNDAISKGAKDFNADSGFLSNVAAGAGKAVSDVGLGVRQMFGKASQGEVDEAAARDKALMSTGGGLLGNIGTQVGMALLPGGAAVRAGNAMGAPMLTAAGKLALSTPASLTGAAVGAGMGAGQAALQPVQTGDSRAGNAAFGAVAGAAVPVAGMALKGGKAMLEPLYAGGRDVIVGRAMNEAAGSGRDAVVQALQGARELVPGSAPTAAEVAGNGGIAALQRAAAQAYPAPYEAVRGVQNNARLAHLDSIAPRAGSRSESAANFGNLYDATVPRLEGAARRKVTEAFDSIDPFNEVKIQLPLDQMKAAHDKFLGAGTFGAGGKSAAALQEAEKIGMESVKIGAPKAQGQTLAQAIRKAGGIKADGSGELASLTNKGSGSSGLVTRNGTAADLMADDMARRGFINSADPDEMVKALEGGFRGREAMGHDTPDAVFAALRGASEGGPTGAQIPKSLPFQTIQNFRSSLGEAAHQAGMAGNKKEAAALRQMATEIENKVASVAEGKGNFGEAFAPDQIDAWRNALRLHSEKMQKFHTGPQKSGFKTGGDGQPVTQGGEWANKFFNSTGAQQADMQSFKRVAGDQQALVDALKSHAMTDAVGNKSTLTNAAFQNWRGNKSQALGELLDSGEIGKIENIAADLARREFADNAGRLGSNTFQNLAMDNIMKRSGLPGSVGDIPGVGRGLSWVYDKTDGKMRERMAEALLNPQQSAQLMQGAVPSEARQRIADALMMAGKPLAIGAGMGALNGAQ